MTYAQKNYTSQIGDTTNTIAEAGSFLTALSNLLLRFDIDVSPETLASRFESLETDPSKLTWTSISQLFPEIGVFEVKNGHPQFSDSIVAFDFNGRKSYGAVADATAGTIIDSFDGEEKDWDLYGAPAVYATFVKYKPLEVTPLVFAQSVPETPVSDTPAEDSIVADTTTEISQEQLEATVEKFNLEVDDPIDTTTGIFEDVTPVIVKTAANTPDLWKMSLKTGLGVIETVAHHDAIIEDLEGEQPDIQLKAGTIVNIAGRFTKDGKTYYRTTGSTKNDHWYGIPAGVLGKSESQSERELDSLLDEINLTVDDDLNTREKIIKSAATVEGKVLGIFRKNKKQPKGAE